MGIRVIGYYDSEAEARKAKENSPDYYKGFEPYKVDSGPRSGSWSLTQPKKKKQKKAGGGSVKKKNYAYGGRVAKYKD
jgi:hypothetical protein